MYEIVLQMYFNRLSLAIFSQISTRNRCESMGALRNCCKGSSPEKVPHAKKKGLPHREDFLYFSGRGRGIKSPIVEPPPPQIT